MPQKWILFCSLMLPLAFFNNAVRVVEGRIDKETLLCDLKIFVPFTFHGVPTNTISGGSQSEGFSHMAAAWMAMEHFNARDSSVVAELNEDLYQNCKIKFDIGELISSANSTGTVFFDTASGGHQGSHLMFLHSKEREGPYKTPCAFVGPYHEGSALIIGKLAATARVPHIPSGGMDARLAEVLLSPFTNVIYPRIYDVTSALARFLIVHQRTNYIATLYAYADMPSQLQEAISIALDSLKVRQKQSFGYLAWESILPIEGQAIPDALNRIKKTGYRTIIVTMGNFVYDLPLIADAAEELGLNTEAYCWIFVPPFHLEEVEGFIALSDSARESMNPPIPAYTNVRKLLTGAALVHPVEGFQIQPDQDKFSQAWKSINESFIERLHNQATVINPRGTFRAEEYERTSLQYFQTHAPVAGSGFLFDAIMSVGMGACIAEEQQRIQKTAANQSFISSEEQIEGIRSVNFWGSTGPIEFGESAGVLGTIKSARLSERVVVGIFNLFPPTNDSDEKAQGSIVLTASMRNLLGNGELAAVMDGGNMDEYVTIDEYRPFMFRDGTSTAPKLLRAPANQNFLSPALRYVGLSLMGLALLCCFLFGVWVFLNRQHRIVLASQPHFLYLLMIGAAITSLSILFVSTDENWGFSVEQLSRHCMAIVWLASIGHLVTYAALFTKLWRVNKVLQFSRRQINTSHVAWPSALLMVAALTMLALWQALDPLQWVRVELDEVSGDSIGQCDSEYMGYYILALAVVLMIPSILTCLMAWKTKDVADDYAESTWIFTQICCQLEVIIVAIPLVVVLRDVSTDGKYIGYVLLLWSMPMSTILLIMLPKVITHYKAVYGISNVSQVRGSSGGGIRVSGIPSSLNRVSDPRPCVNCSDKRTPAEEEVGEFAED